MLGRGHSVITRGRTLAAACAAIVAAGALTIAGSAVSAPSRAPETDGTILYGNLPPAGTRVAGGTITVGQLQSAVPTWFFPIATGANSGTQNVGLASNLFVPLYAGPNGAQPETSAQLSLAAAPVPSNGDKTYTITLNPGFTWADGQAVTATDVIFSYDLLRAAVDENLSNWGQIVPGQFPQNVTSAKAIGADEVQFTLKSPENPSYFLYNQLQDTDWGLYAMPSTVWNETASGTHVSDWQGNEKVDTEIFNYLNGQAKDLSTWVSNPLWKDVDGPYRLTSFNTTNSDYTLTPDPSYGASAKPSATISVRTYPDTADELAAFRSGQLDITAASYANLSADRAAASGNGTLYGGPGFGWFGGVINFKDATDDFSHVIAQTYVRQAIQRLIDEPAIAADAYHGAALPQYGPVAAAPASPFTPTSATRPADTYDPSAAAALLERHGWDVRPDGLTTCARAGTAASDCGAGIPTGTPIKFVWANPPASYTTSAVGESEVLAKAARRYCGIDIELKTESIDFLEEDYDDAAPNDRKYENDWGVNNFGGLFTDYYPTAAGIWTPGGGFNFGDYDNAEENRLVRASETSSSPDAVKTELNYLSTSLPVFFFPIADNLDLVSNKVGGSATGFLALTQQQFEPQYFYRVG